MFAKIPVLELLPKILSPDQIAGFQKIKHFEEELRHEFDFLYVSERSIGLCMVGRHMPELLQNDK